MLKDRLVKHTCQINVDRFLKIVWKISNLNKSRRLIYV